MKGAGVQDGQDAGELECTPEGDAVANNAPDSSQDREKDDQEHTGRPQLVADHDGEGQADPAKRAAALEQQHQEGERQQDERESEEVGLDPGQQTDGGCVEQRGCGGERQPAAARASRPEAESAAST